MSTPPRSTARLPNPCKPQTDLLRNDQNTVIPRLKAEECQELFCSRPVFRFPIRPGKTPQNQAWVWGRSAILSSLKLNHVVFQLICIQAKRYTVIQQNLCCFVHVFTSYAIASITSGRLYSSGQRFDPADLHQNPLKLWFQRVFSLLSVSFSGRRNSEHRNGRT